MTEGDLSRPKQYVVEEIRRAAAHDERLGELDLQVKVVGRDVYVKGRVGTEERRRAVSTVVRELLPEFEVHNQVTVFQVTEPASEEWIE